MNKQTRVSNSMYCFLPTEVGGLGPLVELALDMRWSWNHYADDVWRQLDPDLWELTHKAHPADQAGQALIQQWMRFIRRPEARPHVIFLSDYDMLLTEHLMEGVAVWLNTPRRPWEASGTSGMKVLVNGGINLSELDGWWAEAYTPEVGWAIGDGKEHGDDPAWDAAEAETLYYLLEREVISEFYNRDKNGLPAAWVARMRESMARLIPRFSANRTVRQYTEQHYLPAATAYRERAANQCAVGRQVVEWRHTLEEKWSTLRFGDLRVETKDEQHMFEVEIFLNDLDPNAVRVELYADGAGGAAPLRQEMMRVRQLAGGLGGGMWIWTVFGVLVVVLLVVAITKLSKKKSRVHDPAVK